MGWFTKKDTPESLARKFSDYFEMFEHSVLGYIFKFHGNDGNDITFCENTSARKVILKRNYSGIELIKYDKEDNIIFKSDRSVILSDDDDVVFKAIHQLYFEEMPE